MATLRGLNYLKSKLEYKRSKVNLRYNYYEMKELVRDFGISTPPDLKSWMPCLGWCGKAVDTLADRIVFDTFADDNFDLMSIFNMNNPDTFFDSAVLSALISSCCFVYISAGDDGFPRLQVIDGGNATGISDPFTGLLTEGYAVLERNDNGVAVSEAYFVPGKTTFMIKGQKTFEILNSAPYPLLVPIINRPDARRPFGHSRISRACMSIQGSAVRTIKRSEIAAEFFSYPQKWVTGLDPNSEPMKSWTATMSSMLAFTKDSKDGSPQVGQFAQQSMAPHTEQLRTFASLFAGETGLTLDDIGFVTDNPSSAEAIKASHESLRLLARKAQRNFGSGFLNVGYLAACLRDDYAYKRSQVYLTHATWAPVFEPDATTLSGIGDGAIKINQAVPGYIDKNNLKTLTGITGGDSTEGGE